MMLATAPELGLMGRHVLHVTDLSATEIALVIGIAAHLKVTRTSDQQTLLRGKTLNRGSQYPSAACRARVALAGAVTSFSRPGNPYDNALPGTTQAEFGWSLKTELLPHGTAFASLEEARL